MVWVVDKCYFFVVFCLVVGSLCVLFFSGDGVLKPTLLAMDVMIFVVVSRSVGVEVIVFVIVGAWWLGGVLRCLFWSVAVVFVSVLIELLMVVDLVVVVLENQSSRSFQMAPNIK